MLIKPMGEIMAWICSLILKLMLSPLLHTLLDMKLVRMMLICLPIPLVCISLVQYMTTEPSQENCQRCADT